LNKLSKNQQVFIKALAAFLVSKSRVITDDKNSANLAAIQELKKEKSMPEDIQVR
jgi:transposase, IS6 family